MAFPPDLMDNWVINWVFPLLPMFHECKVKNWRAGFCPFVDKNINTASVLDITQLNYKGKLDKEVKIKVMLYSLVILLKSDMKKLFQSPKYSTYHFWKGKWIIILICFDIRYCKSNLFYGCFKEGDKPLFGRKYHS